MARNATVQKVDKYARTAPTLEGVSIELALASLYDPTVGNVEASRVELAELTHYTEKRIRTLTKGLASSGRWAVQENGNKAKTFVPLFA